jgi:hypothetical protein
MGTVPILTRFTFRLILALTDANCAVDGAGSIIHCATSFDMLAWVPREGK